MACSTGWEELGGVEVIMATHYTCISTIYLPGHILTLHFILKRLDNNDNIQIVFFYCILRCLNCLVISYLHYSGEHGGAGQDITQPAAGVESDPRPGGGAQSGHCQGRVWSSFAKFPHWCLLLLESPYKCFHIHLKHYAKWVLLPLSG